MKTDTTPVADGFLYIRPAAKKLGVTEVELRRYIGRGCPSHRQGKRIVVKTDEVRAWLEANVQPKRAVQEIEEELAEAKLAKAKADAAMAEIKRQMAADEVVSRPEQEALEQRRIARVREGLLALPMTLPPRLLGLSTDEMSKVIQTEIDRLLRSYAAGRYDEEADV